MVSQIPPLLKEHLEQAYAPVESNADEPKQKKAQKIRSGIKIAVMLAVIAGHRYVIDQVMFLLEDKNPTRTTEDIRRQMEFIDLVASRGFDPGIIAYKNARGSHSPYCNGIYVHDEGFVTATHCIDGNRHSDVLRYPIYRVDSETRGIDIDYDWHQFTGDYQSTGGFDTSTTFDPTETESCISQPVVGEEVTIMHWRFANPGRTSLLEGEVVRVRENRGLFVINTDDGEFLRSGSSGAGVFNDEGCLVGVASKVEPEQIPSGRFTASTIY